MGDRAIDVYGWPTVQHKCQDGTIRSVKFFRDRDGTQITCSKCDKTFTYRRSSPNPQYMYCMGAVEIPEPSRR